MHEPMLIAFEGIDGSGKTSLLELVFHKLSADFQVERTREPDGTDFGAVLGRSLRDTRHLMSSRTQTLAFMAARSSVAELEIAPALAGGSVVLVDRFLASTLAYQGMLGQRPLQEIVDLHLMATRSPEHPVGLLPDVTVFVEISEHDSAEFKARRGLAIDRFDAFKGRQVHLAYARVLSDPDLVPYHGQLIVAKNGLDADLYTLAEEVTEQISSLLK